MKITMKFIHTAGLMLGVSMLAGCVVEESTGHPRYHNHYYPRHCNSVTYKRVCHGSRYHGRVCRNVRIVRHHC